MITPILTLLLCLPVTQKPPHGTIAVLVRSAGHPVPQALVRVEQNDLLTSMTDTDGKIRISLPAGKWTIAIKAAGFGPESV